MSNFHEMEYIRAIEYIKRLIEFEDNTDVKDLNDYEFGVSEGKKELGEELLLAMYDRVIHWNFFKDER